MINKNMRVVSAETDHSILTWALLKDFHRVPVPLFVCLSQELWAVTDTKLTTAPKSIFDFRNITGILGYLCLNMLKHATICTQNVLNSEASVYWAGRAEVISPGER